MHGDGPEIVVGFFLKFIPQSLIQCDVRCHEFVGNTFYILDEPTTGLHFEDIRVLMEVINKLVDKGNTILIIEHNMDVIKLADYIIDIGPEGGKGGGQLIAKGTPEEIIKVKKSYTAQFLKKELL